MKKFTSLLLIFNIAFLAININTYFNLIKKPSDKKEAMVQKPDECNLRIPSEYAMVLYANNTYGLVCNYGEYTQMYFNGSRGGFAPLLGDGTQYKDTCDMKNDLKKFLNYIGTLKFKRIN